jgi:hypothetical protein
MDLFGRKKRWENHGGNINIIADLKESDIERIRKEKDIHSLQFYKFKDPSKKTWKVIDKFSQKYPEIRLHIFWYNEVDFSFLQHLPSVRKFAVSSFLTKDFTPIKDYLELDYLSIGETKSLAVNVDFITSFKHLKGLYIDGMKNGLDAITHLTELESLSLRGVKLNDLRIADSL